MLNAGTLEVEVFELSYRQDYSNDGFYFGYSFAYISVEPILAGAGYLNSGQCLQALGLEDYGYMFCGDRVLSYATLQYNGQQFSQFAATSGQATGAFSDESASHYTAMLYDLAPFGKKAGLPNYPFSPAASYTHQADISGDNGHIDAQLSPGPCYWPQDFTSIDGSGVKSSDFVLPYCQYDYFTLLGIGAELGIAFCDPETGLPLTNNGSMIAAKNFYNTGFENQTGCTNVLGSFVQASTYIPANFIPWNKWSPRGGEQTASLTQTELPNEEPLSDIFSNGAYIQNARDFFIFKSNNSLFPGQPETPVIYNPITNVYQPIKWLPQTAAAAQLVANGGMQVAYSKLQNCFYMIGTTPDYPHYIFGSNFTYPLADPVIETPPGLVLRLPHFSVVPKLTMPCYGVRAPQPKLSR